MPDDVLRLEGVTKRYGAVTALRAVDLHLARGEVLGLIGDNGAGKSTLIKVLCGFHRPDAGRVLVRGVPTQLRNVRHARSLGIEYVPQDLALVDELSVHQNLALGRERVHRPLPLLAERAMRRDARRALDELGVDIPDLDRPVGRLSGGQRQAIAVARAVHAGSDVLLLDEPLAAMGVREGARILETIDRLRADGRVSIVLIAHNHAQVLEVCDRVNLLQHGAVVFDAPAAQTSIRDLDAMGAEAYRRGGGGQVARDPTPTGAPRWPS
jgi:ABC-type sugar transport system ATPase subunit